MQQLFKIQRKGFTAAQPDVYVLNGFFAESDCEGRFFRAFCGMEEVKTELLVHEGAAVYRKYQALDNGSFYADREYFVCIRLPHKWDGHDRLRVFECLGQERVLICQPAGQFLKKERKKLNGSIDGARFLTAQECKTEHLKKTAGKQYAGISGWALSARPFSVEVRNGAGTVLESKTERFVREDLGNVFPEFFSQMLSPGEAQPCGFRTVFEVPAGRLSVRLTDGVRFLETELQAADGQIVIKGPGRGEKLRRFYEEQGLGRTLRFCLHRGAQYSQAAGLNGTGQPDYNERRAQEEEKTVPVRQEIKPLFSVIVPLFFTKEEHLRELVASVQKQTYTNWELCLSDGGGDETRLDGYLQELCRADTRIRMVKSREKLGISENTNAALAIATGDYLVFADHDDLLHPQALAECAARIQAEPEIDLIYTDEDKVSMDGTRHFQPHFKPDYNKELLQSMNYFCHLVVVKRSLQQQAGTLDAAFNGAQDYDFVLRCAEKAARICHIPKVLYHWRAHADSTAENPESKRYAFEAGTRALNAHYERCKIPAKAEPEEIPGLYRRIWEKREPDPLISVILYGNKKKNPAAAYPNLEMIQAAGEDAKALNAAAQAANGELLLFWNTELDLLTPEGLQDMAALCMQSDAGAVGPKVTYNDGRIRQCGVIFEKDGSLYRAFEGTPQKEPGYFARINTVMEVSAVLKECMMVRRRVFEEAGGFDPVFQKQYADADFCLRMMQKGLRNIYCPVCVCQWNTLLEKGDLMAKQDGKKERILFAERWKEILEKGDPNYNPNLSVRCADYSLRLQ